MDKTFEVLWVLGGLVFVVALVTFMIHCEPPPKPDPTVRECTCKSEAS